MGWSRADRRRRAARRGRRRERRGRPVPRRRRRAAIEYADSEPMRARQRRAAAAAAASIVARGARRDAGARQRRPGHRHRDRPRRVRASRRGADRAGRRGDAGRGHERDGQLDPRQRLVRHAHQADRRALDRAAPASAATSTPSATQWLYVGDSTNDEPMFASFPLSVGVANMLDFADRLQRWPAYRHDARPRPRLRRGRRGAARRARR